MPSLKPLNWSSPGAGTHPMKGGGGRRGAGLHPMTQLAALGDHGDVLLAEALTKTRDKLQRRGETTMQSSKPPKAPPPPPPPTPKRDLWSWDSEVRIQLGAHAALRWLWTEGGVLWLIQPELAPPNAPSKLQGSASELLCIDVPSDSPVFELQTPRVIAAASARGDVMAEILTQQHEFWPFFAAITRLEAESAPRTMELLAVAYRMATAVTMEIKNALACPRPIDLSVHVGPCIPTPGHASLPAGHAVVAFLFAALLPRLLGKAGPKRTQRRQQLLRLAHRISHNRVVAGLHFPVDAVAGRLLGEVLADYFIAVCGAAKSCDGGGRMGVRTECEGFDRHAELPRDSEVRDGRWPDSVIAACDITLPVKSLPVRSQTTLKRMWEAARVELGQLKLG